MASKRIHAFDIVRAIAIFLMILAHTHGAWLDAESQWLEGLLYCILSPMGVPGFLYVSGMSFGFSWANRDSKGESYKEISVYQFSRTVLIFIISFIYNTAAVLIHGGGVENLWFWFILQTLAISRLVGLAIMKFNKVIRISFSVALILLTPLILDGLNATRANNGFLQVIYFILFNPVGADSIMFFFPMFVAGSVIGQEIYQFVQSEDFKNMKILTLLGFIFLILGVLLGLQGIGIENSWAWISEFSTHPDWNFTTIPMFLVRNTYAWLLYSLGWEIVLSILVFYIVDYKLKREKRSEFELYGKYSFTIYITHYLCYLLPFEFSYKTIIFAFIGFMALLWLMIHIIDTKSQGKISLEYVVGYGSKAIYQLMLENSKKSEEIVEK